MSYPETSVERLRIAAEWVTVLFVWDDLFDVPDSRLVDDRRSAEEINRIMTGVLTHPEKFEEQEGLCVANAFHSYVNIYLDAAQKLILCA